MKIEGNPARINTLLLLLVGLLSGGIVGYLLAQSETSSTPATAAIQTTIQLNDVLPIEDVWIVGGFSCPVPGCTKPLLTCQEALPRQIRDWVNSERVRGRSGEEIRAEIIQTHGPSLDKLTSDSL